MSINSKILYYLIGSLLFFVSNETYAGNYTISNISINEGLSHKAINCIYQDKKGFVWIGTSDGLNRFDGYSFKQYFNNASDSLSIGTNVVTGISEDSTGMLWLSTATGFYRYNPVDESFRRIKIKDETVIRQAEGVCVDDYGIVWGVDNNSKVIKINPKSLIGESIKLDSILGLSETLYNKKIIWAFGYFWINTFRGIVRFDVSKMKAELIPSKIGFNSPRIIRKGRQNELLIVDWISGIYTLNTVTLQWKPLLEHTSLAGVKDIVGFTDVQYDQKDNSFWVIGYPGLYKILSNGEIVNFNRSSGYDQDYDKLVYFTSMIDNVGNIWLGMQDEGLLVLTNQHGICEHYSIVSPNFKDLPALRFFVSDEEMLFCNLSGTFYSRNKEDRSKGRFTLLTNSITQQISKYNENEYLIFTKNAIHKFNKINNSLTKIYETDILQNGLVDSRGIIWITHWEYGMEGYNPTTKKKYRFDVDTLDKSSNVVFTLIEDSDGSLWLGTFGAGLQHIENPDSENPKITVYRFDKSKNSISNNFIVSLHADNKGFIWIGTNGGGLNCFDKKNNTFKVYNTNNGLKSNVIQAITSDKNGDIWFTSTIVSKFSVKEGKFTHYGFNDGIRSKYFNLCAQTDKNGIIYFGDDKGVLSINPYELQDMNVPPVPVITSVRLFGQVIETRQVFNNSIPFPKSISYSDTISLSYNQNSLSLEFACIQPSERKNMIYQYMLEGIDKQWITTHSSERLATYTGLAPGKYLFKVKTSSGKENWSDQRELLIIITPPWWNTWWFITFSLLFTLTSIVSVVYYRFQNIKKQNFLLEQKVSERTERLKYANEAMNEKQLFIEMKNEQLSQMLESKDKLINVIAHDFRNPLGGIIGASSLLKESADKINSQKINKYITILNDSAYSLSNQMTTLLEWAQSQDQNLESKPVEINLELLLTDAINLVSGSAANKEIGITTQIDIQTNAFVDPRMISMVFRNILSNAIKYSPRGGNVVIIMQEYEKDIDTTFIDSGIGMSQEIIDSLSNESGILNSTAGTENEKGSGLGLKLCNLFIKKNTGQLTISSQENKGTTVTVTLPKGENLITVKNKNIQVEESTVKTIALTREENKFTLLLIEDDKEVQEIIFGIFEDNYTIIKAFDGINGLNLAQQMQPDLIISDVNLPGRNGIEICKSLKKNSLTNHIPLLIITSDTDINIKNSAFEFGANDFIEKPFNPFHLKKKVESLLEYGQTVKKKINETGVSNIINNLPEDYDHKIIKNVIEYINANLDKQDLNTITIAENISMSRSQLWRIFKRITGHGLSEYIKDLRMQKAALLLRNGNFRVSEIAYEVGFSDPAYFTRNFSKEFGMSPTDYAKKMADTK